jgi:peptide deformylase
MILPVVKYGHPVLRKRGARIEQVTPAIKNLIQDMLETMRHASGVGLAAQQIGQALQLTVIDVRGIKDRPSTLERSGREARVEDFMPLILINPEVTPVGKPVTGPEGCLSFPEIFADISRSETVDVRALDDAGGLIQFRCGGLLARAVQHEMDHLNGILFIDRMDTEEKRSLKPELDALAAATKASLKAGLEAQ